MMSDLVSASIGRTVSGRRVFPIGFKVEFLQAWDACIERGAKTRLLREYQLDRETIARWLEARDRGEFGVSMVKAAEKSRSRMDARDRAELARLRVENQRLKKKVDQAEAAQEILGKAFGILEQINQSPELESKIPPSLMSLDQYQEWLNQNRLS